MRKSGRRPRINQQLARALPPSHPPAVTRARCSRRSAGRIRRTHAARTLHWYEISLVLVDRALDYAADVRSLKWPKMSYAIPECVPPRTANSHRKPVTLSTSATAAVASGRKLAYSRT